LITRNAGAGKIPWSTKRFIKKHPSLIKGFVNNGDSVKHGRTYCGATPLIIEKYGLKHIRNIDRGGSLDDVKAVQAFLAEL
ncbi:class Ib ribonucleoside-diphosphate reductase assembly flavoprotein NrdI, partial [Streptococcus sp. DD11]|uniref:class Ib ribonucleoside-diphosphate reductase assembly flavoprotein NrdI n=1 Tax=Streptococcus sp. DD11 TaxID=1777879 RepID=UPI0010082041